MCQHVSEVRSEVARKVDEPAATTNPHVKYPSGSPNFIIAIKACTRRLPLMPHHRNGRTGSDGVVRPEPGASPSARLSRRQADHGGHRRALLTWVRGEVASITYCTAIGKAWRYTCLYDCSSSFFVLPGFVLTALHFSDADQFFPSLARSGSTTPPRPML